MTQSDPMQDQEKCKGSKIKDRIALTLTFFDCLLFGGSVIGWASIVYVLKEDGVFSQLCTINVTHTEYINDTTSDSTLTDKEMMQYGFGEMTASGYPRCPEQDATLSMAFTIAMVFQGISSIPFGAFFDHFGIRITKTFTGLMYISALLMLAFAQPGDSSYLVFLAVLFLGVTIVLMSGMLSSHIALLAGRKASIFVTLYSGAVNVSAAVMLVVKLVSEMGIKRMYSFTFLAGFYFIFMLYTYCVLPYYKAVPFQPCEDIIVTDVVEEKVKPIETIAYSEKSCEKQSPKPPPKKAKKQKMTQAAPEEIPFQSCMCSVSLILHLFWFSVLNLRVLNYIGNFNSWVTMRVKGDHELVSHFTNMFGYMQIAAQILCPIPGGLIDYRLSKLPSSVKGFPRSIAVAPALLLCTLLYVLLSIAVLLPGHVSIYSSMIFAEAGRAFLYGVSAAYLQITFPTLHYGKLVGLAFFVNGVLMVSQYPMTIWVEQYGSYQPVLILLLVLSCLATVHPITVFWRYRVKE